MSKFYFENQGNGTYLVYPVGPDEQVDALTLGMLTNNSIKNFAPVVYTQQDEKKYIKYNVTTRISVQQLLMSPVNKKQLLGVLNGIAAAVSDAEEYMIDVRSILFDQNYIFVDAAGETTVMICLPVAGKQKQLPDMKLFFKELLFTVSLNSRENNDYFVRMINYLNKEASFSTEAFSDFLKKAFGRVSTGGTGGCAGTGKTGKCAAEGIAGTDTAAGIAGTGTATAKSAASCSGKYLSTSATGTAVRAAGDVGAETAGTEAADTGCSGEWYKCTEKGDVLVLSDAAL